MKAGRLIQRKYLVLIIVLLYIALNLSTLTKFPLMHSDESWLSGLSRHILVTGDYSATEPFFDLKPRQPHALKIIFHTLQMLVIKAFGYTLFNMRLLSLIFGLATVYYFYRLCLLVLPAKKWATWACLFIGVDIQFVYASHFGRQEIILLWVMVFGIYYYLKKITSNLYRPDIILGALTGLGIGIHPNSLIITLIFSSIYVTHVFEKKKKLRSFLIFGLTSTLVVLGFIILSYQLDPNFLGNYFNYGEEQFKVLRPFSTKLIRLLDFAKNIYLRRGGTYYLPELKAQFVLLSTLFIVAVTMDWRQRDIIRKPVPAWIPVSIISLIAGLVLIGRYNTTSIVFFTPFIYLLAGFSLAKLPEKIQKNAPMVLFIILLLLMAQNIYPFLKYDYNYDIKRVAAVVGPDRKVLASLNLEYAFNDGNLLDLRNLSFLKKQELTFTEYIRKNQIEYLIYPEGLDFIYRTRPTWNGVYGHLPYYREMRQFLQEKCRLITSFASPAYGIEIPAYVGRKQWLISIYRVLP